MYPRPARRLCTLAVVLSFLVGASSAVAGTVEMTASADTMLFSGSYANNVYGAADIMGIYWGSARQKSLLRFDLGSVPAGATVESAVLTLYVDGHGGPGVWNNGNHVPTDVYRVTHAWVEGEATWNVRSSGIGWFPPGGSYVGTTGQYETSPWATNSESVSSPGDPLTWDVTALVQGWLDGTWDNDGLAVMTRTSFPMNQLHFRTVDFADPAYHPTLSLTFVPLPGAAASGLVLLALLAIAGRARRRRRAALRAC